MIFNRHIAVLRTRKPHRADHSMDQYVGGCGR
jgi:hypothetical protein